MSNSIALAKDQLSINPPFLAQISKRQLVQKTHSSLPSWWFCSRGIKGFGETDYSERRCQERNEGQAALVEEASPLKLLTSARTKPPPTQDRHILTKFIILIFVKLQCILLI